MGLEKPGLIKFAKPGKIVGGLAALDFGVNAISSIKEGHGVLPSLAKAGVSTIASDMMFGMLGPAGQALLLTGTLATAGVNFGIKIGQSNAKDLGGAISGSGLLAKAPINSQSAVTMRRRGMAIINESGEATRSVLGSEARAYFRNSMY